MFGFFNRSAKSATDIYAEALAAEAKVQVRKTAKLAKQAKDKTDSAERVRIAKESAMANKAIFESTLDVLASAEEEELFQIGDARDALKELTNFRAGIPQLREQKLEAARQRAAERLAKRGQGITTAPTAHTTTTSVASGSTASNAGSAAGAKTTKQAPPQKKKTVKVDPKQERWERLLKAPKATQAQAEWAFKATAENAANAWINVKQKQDNAQRALLLNFWNVSEEVWGKIPPDLKIPFVGEAPSQPKKEETAAAPATPTPTKGAGDPNLGVQGRPTATTATPAVGEQEEIKEEGVSFDGEKLNQEDDKSIEI